MLFIVMEIIFPTLSSWFELTEELDAISRMLDESELATSSAAVLDSSVIKVGFVTAIASPQYCSNEAGESAAGSNVIDDRMLVTTACKQIIQKLLIVIGRKMNSEKLTPFEYFKLINSLN